VQNTKPGKSIPNYHYVNITNGRKKTKWPKIHQHLSSYDPPKCTQITIFGLKTTHLATLAPTLTFLYLCNASLFQTFKKYFLLDESFVSFQKTILVPLGVFYYFSA
jgi:hypothetical protein